LAACIKVLPVLTSTRVVNYSLAAALVTFCLAKVERVYSTKYAVIPRISFLRMVLVGAYTRSYRVGAYYVVEFKIIILTLNKFSFINLIKLDNHWCEMMLQKLNVVDDSCESTLVLKRKADILRISYDVSIHQ